MGCKAIDDAFDAARDNAPKGAERSSALNGVKVELQRNPTIPRFEGMIPGDHGR
jgi:hypothetical protein